MDARAIRQQAIDLGLEISGYDLRRKSHREELLIMILSKSISEQVEQQTEEILCLNCPNYAECQAVDEPFEGDCPDEIDPYETEEREAIEVEHLQPEEATEFFNPPKLVGFYHDNHEVALVKIADEIRYIPISWESELMARSKRNELFVENAQYQVAICKLEIQIDKEGDFKLFPVTSLAGKVGFLAPDASTRYAEIQSKIRVSDTIKKVVEADTGHQTPNMIYSKHHVLCRVIKCEHFTQYYPLKGWFESVGGKWNFAGNPDNMYWLDEVQAQLAYRYKIGNQYWHQAEFKQQKATWEIVNLYYQHSLLMAEVRCLYGNHIYKHGEVQRFPAIELMPAKMKISNNFKQDRYVPTEENESYNSLLDSIAIKKAYRIAQEREEESRDMHHLERLDPYQPEPFDGRF